jgi:acyl carrier protein
MERVIELIGKVGGLDAIEPDAPLYESGFSSVRALELLLAMEEEFGITIPDQEFMAARTPRALAELVERLREQHVA